MPATSHQATSHRRVAISTFWDGSESYECALPLWCQSARQLAVTIPERDAQVVVVAPRATEECPGARFVWDEETKAASLAYVKRFTQRNGRWIGEGHLKDAVLLKWTIFSEAFSAYDLVFFTDLDIDVLPQSTRRPALVRDWRVSIDAFMASAALYVSSPDHASPSNTGVILAKPRAWVHRQALNVLANASFNGRTGFDDVGAPLDLFGHERSTTRLLHQLHAGAAARRGVGDNEGCCVYFCKSCNFKSHTESGLNMTAYHRGNHWQFVCANLDQGMFWFHEVRWSVDHFWGMGKPWMRGTARASYLNRLDLPMMRAVAARAEGTRPRAAAAAAAAAAAGNNATRCERQLFASIQELKRRGDWLRPKGPGPKTHAVLPAPTVVDFKPGGPYGNNLGRRALARARPGQLAQMQMQASGGGARPKAKLKHVASTSRV